MRTVTGIANAIVNPLETWNGIKQAANETWSTIKSGDLAKIAALAGNLVGNSVGGGITGKAFSTLGKLAKASKYGKTVRNIAKKIPCGCFLAGTLIFTDTCQKAIEEIQVGDKVWAYNDTAGNYALKKVVSLLRYVRDSVYNIRIGEETIQATADHPFFISGHWLRIAELKVGDSVKTYDGSNLAIEQITVALGRTTVYNFEVEDYHRYYVSHTKVLVHNNGPCDDTPDKPNKFHGNDSKSTAPRETYTIEDDNGKPYHGVGDVEGKRAKQSLERLRKDNPDRTFENKDRTRHENSADALKDEYRRQKGTSGNDATGKPKNQYEKNWSPGKKL